MVPQKTTYKAFDMMKSAVISSKPVQNLYAFICVKVVDFEPINISKI